MFNIAEVWQMDFVAVLGPFELPYLVLWPIISMILRAEMSTFRKEKRFIINSTYWIATPPSRVLSDIDRFTESRLCRSKHRPV